MRVAIRTTLFRSLQLFISSTNKAFPALSCGSFSIPAAIVPRLLFLRSSNSISFHSYAMGNNCCRDNEEPPPSSSQELQQPQTTARQPNDAASNSPPPAPSIESEAVMSANEDFVEAVVAKTTDVPSGQSVRYYKSSVVFTFVCATSVYC